MADTSTHSWKLLYETGRQALQDRKLQEAEQSFSAALQLAEDFAAGDPRLAATLNALARIYSLQRRYLAAAALLNRLLEVTERTLGPAHVQVGGVLTNLAEMYTHLGAVREELELRERVLAIRAGDPNADPASVQRLQERVAELRSTIAAQEPPEADEDDAEIEFRPGVRAPEQAAPIPRSEEPRSEEYAPVVERVSPIAEPMLTVEHESAGRTSPASPLPSIAPWPGVAATTPSGARSVELDHAVSVAASIDAPVAVSLPSTSVPRISIPNQPALAVMGRAERGADPAGAPAGLPFARRAAGWSNLYSIAAGVLLVAGVLAARGYVTGSDDERVSAAGSVNLATGAPSAASGAITPVAQTASEPRTVERLVAERRLDREGTRSSATDGDASREADRAEASSRPEVAVPKPPRAPAEIERALRGVDFAVRSVDQRTRAATDSALAIRMQAPTFKKVRLADP